MADLSSVSKNGLKVFSCFACAGGSTMGYKQAGFDVIGHNDIDPKMVEVYRANHKPKHTVLAPVVSMVGAELHKDLYDLDVLDGSPPCSTFSMGGSREDAWGKDKVFREGQAKQVLDDLFFDFIKLADQLRPRVVVSENVKGMILGNAKWYVVSVVEAFKRAGYSTSVFVLNGASVSLPQSRERVFFVSTRDDLSIKKPDMRFNQRPVVVSDALADAKREGKPLTARMAFHWKRTPPGKSLAASTGKSSFTWIKLHPNKPSPTITAGPATLDYEQPRHIGKDELCLLGSFPRDYNFLSIDPRYVIGMSVPPLMMQSVASRVAATLE